MTEAQQIIIQAFKDAIIETVIENGDIGTPAGILYAAFLKYNLSLEDFQNVCLLCEREGKIVLRGTQYYPKKLSK